LATLLFRAGGVFTLTWFRTLQKFLVMNLG